jgi:carboxyl-terminal processing protease
MKKFSLVGMSVMSTLLATSMAYGADNANAERDLFKDAIERVRSSYVRPVNDGELFDGALQGMVSGLDPHSGYMDAKEYDAMRATTKGQFGGIGIEVDRDDGYLRVIAPIDGSPAARAGIKAGDGIAGIDGKSTADMRLEDALEKMRGAAGSRVALTIQREGEEKPREVTLVRAIVPLAAASHRREGNIGYIRMPGFNEQTATGLEQAVRELKQQIGPGIKGYVLDLRDNPGGLVSQAVRVSDDFLNAGEIVSTRGRRPQDAQRFVAAKGDITEGKPVVVLINDGTASAAEIVSGALQDHKRATVIGLTSYGKGTVQTIIPLGEGRGALRLTTSRYYTPSGHSIQAQGIIPDIEVAQDDKVRKREPESSEADLPGHISGDPVPAKRPKGQVIKPAPGTKHEDFQLSYALDFLQGKMAVASAAPQKAGAL